MQSSTAYFFAYVKKFVEPCKYKNISLPQYCVVPYHFLFMGWLTGAFVD